MILSYDKTARLWSVKWWTGIYLSLKCKGCVIPMLSLLVWKAIKSEGYNTSSNVSRPPTLVAHQATRFHKMLFKLYTSKVLHDMFLASTKQLYEWFSLSVCLSVRPSHLFSCDQAALWMVFSVRLSVCPSVCLSVCPSVRLSHLFDYVPIIVSSWNFQELSHWTRVRSMQKVKVRGQRSRSQRSRPKFSFPDCNSSLNSHMMIKLYI